MCPSDNNGFKICRPEHRDQKPADETTANSDVNPICSAVHLASLEPQTSKRPWAHWWQRRRPPRFLKWRLRYANSGSGAVVERMNNNCSSHIWSISTQRLEGKTHIRQTTELDVTGWYLLRVSVPLAWGFTHTINVDKLAALKPLMAMISALPVTLCNISVISAASWLPDEVTFNQNWPWCRCTPIKCGSWEGGGRPPPENSSM